AANMTTNGRPAKLRARISKVEIVELYSDRAIEAVRALRSLGRTSKVEGFLIDEFVTVGAGARRRAHYDAPRDWWQRIRVKSVDGGLQIEPLTRVARIPAILEPTSRDEVEIFLKDATSSTALDPSIGYTLFEILLPRELKIYVPD